MKNILFALTLLVSSLAFGQVVPALEKSPIPIRIEPFDPDGYAYAEKLFDFRVGNKGAPDSTVIGSWFDVRKLALARAYFSDTIAAPASRTRGATDSLLGYIVIDCYDIQDSNAVTDSVNFRMTLQGADYAADNSDPARPHSDAAYTIRQFTRTDVSAAQASVVTDTLKVLLPITTHTTQFVRVQGEGLSTAAQNDSRCRVYMARPRWKR